MKKRVVIFMLALLALPFMAGCAELDDMIETETTEVVTMADYPYYFSFAELTDQASYVVRVSVLDERVEMLNTSIPFAQGEDPNLGEPAPIQYWPYTIYTLHVLEVFQGDVRIGDTLEVMMGFGEFEGISVVSMDHKAFMLGDDLVLFLSTFEGSTFPTVLPNPSQAAYRVTYPADASVGRNVSEVFESRHSFNSLILTLGDLAHIWLNDQIATGGEMARQFGDGDFEVTDEILQAILDMGILNLGRAG